MKTSVSFFLQVTLVILVYSYNAESRAARELSKLTDKLREKDLTYKISKYAKNLAKADVDHVIAKAFSSWANHTDITFTQKNGGPVNIDIRFEAGEHGGHIMFDGPGRTLSHASNHANGGFLHFDDDENWNVNGDKEPDLFKSAIHEIGHTLGLKHSNDKMAVMNPFQINADLQPDDIQAIQALYGKKSTG